MTENSKVRLYMRIVYGFAVFAVLAGICLATFFIAYQRFEEAAIKTSKERLSLYQSTLQSTLDRVAHLPRVVVLHPFTGEVLRQGKSVVSYNAFLKSVNDKAGSAALYVLDKDGTTLVASNYDNAESFVGNNYRFRKYYTDAISQGQGSYFAVGVTTGRPGYFLSEAIEDAAGAFGVAVVKVEFLELLESWKTAGENVLISNEDGVIVLASNERFLYKTLQDIPQTRLEEIRQGRQFFGFELEKLNFTSSTSALSGTIGLEGSDFIVTTTKIENPGWNFHFLAPAEPVRNAAMMTVALELLLLGIAAIGILYARSRVERSKLEIAAVEAERVRRVNVRLEREINERKRTEERLRETQAELIQSSRLAALGKMSAAIVHEVNQPVSAIRTYTSSGLLLLSKRKVKDAREVFGHIAKMTERLGAITSDLLVFSRKPVAKPKAVDLNVCIETIVAERAPYLEEHEVKLSLDLWKRALPVIGSQHRFEQLISNLIQNAVQACEQTADRAITITTISDPKCAIIMVGDNGTGIDEEIIDQLFDPFFTTKGVGAGVGLGLALSYAIVDEAGGRIRCENREQGGALFVVELPLAEALDTRSTEAEVDG